MAAGLLPSPERTVTPTTLHPLLRAAIAAACLSTLSGLDRSSPRVFVPKGEENEPGEAPRAPLVPKDWAAPCSPRSIPEGTACLPLPPLGRDITGMAAFVPEQGSHASPGLEAGRGLEVYDHIPKRPERPEAFSSYLWPISSDKVLSGYDLDLPGEAQRKTAQHTGHGGVDIGAARGEEVRVIRLENQEGDAEVAMVGTLFGTTVVTGHLVREQGGRLRAYAVMYGHLEAAGPELVVGGPVSAGEIAGYVGDTGSPGLVHLHVEIRQLREGVALGAIDLQRLVNNAVSIPIDPRNVLPLRESGAN